VTLPTTLQTTVLIRTPWLTLEEQQVEVNGHMENFHVASRRDSVIAVVVTDDDRVVLIDEYKYGTKTRVTQCPGGKIDGSETPQTAIIREVYEETGFQVTKLTPLGQWHPDASWCRDTVYAFGVRVSGSGDPHREATELIETQLVEWDRAVEMAENGEIMDPYSVIAILKMDKVRIEP